jgi:hypothetical protein
VTEKLPKSGLPPEQALQIEHYKGFNVTRSDPDWLVEFGADASSSDEPALQPPSGVTGPNTQDLCLPTQTRRGLLLTLRFRMQAQSE